LSRGTVAIIGAGPYGLSLAAHFSALNIKHRIFGRPMQFWSQIADAADRRYLKSYCFGTNISAPTPGSSFADYNQPRGLETFEPCSMANFAAYGLWFQEKNVPWAEPVDVAHVAKHTQGFMVTLTNGERVAASEVIVATGLSCFAYVPSALAALPPRLFAHTGAITSFNTFAGRSVAVVGAGQSALEAAALLHEAGARPELLVREKRILWHRRVSQQRSLWRRIRSPISGLGTGPKGWALTRFPGAMHRFPERFRTRFVKTHLPAEGAWWLRERFENSVPVRFQTAIAEASEVDGRAALKLISMKDGSLSRIEFDFVIAGCGYDINVDRLCFLDPALRSEIRRIERSPKLNCSFESSVPGLTFVGSSSAMSFGPLFRFVIGAEYTARTISARLYSRA
jgi:FAD-dependent urate hydroxylase